jgi:hypothetical protein
MYNYFINISGSGYDNKNVKYMSLYQIKNQTENDKKINMNVTYGAQSIENRFGANYSGFCVIFSYLIVYLALYFLKQNKLSLNYENVINELKKIIELLNCHFMTTERIVRDFIYNANNFIINYDNYSKKKIQKLKSKIKTIT